MPQPAEYVSLRRGQRGKGRGPAKEKRVNLPPRFDDADWQAHWDETDSGQRVFLDGEPVPLAIAASVSKGWVKAYADHATPEDDDFETASTGKGGTRRFIPTIADGTPKILTLRGLVEIREGDRV